MRQDLFWMPVVPMNMGFKAEIEYSGSKPKRVWTLFKETSKDKKPELPIKPVHHVNAFLEDHFHDWNIRDGMFHYGSRVVDAPVWVLMEFDE